MAAIRRKTRMEFIAVAAVILLVFAVAAWARRAEEKVVHRTVQEGLAQGSLVAEFTDDLLRHRMVLIVGLAVLLVIAEAAGVPREWSRSPWLLAAMVTAIFGGRVILRRLPGPRDDGRARQ
jgi:hypothetical protein